LGGGCAAIEIYDYYLKIMRILAPFLLVLFSNNLGKASPFSIPFSGFSGCAGQSVTSAGFTFTAGRAGSCSLLFLAGGPDFTGETMLDDNNIPSGPGPGILITSSVGLFSALAMDLSFVFPSDFDPPGNVTIIGRRADTTTVSQDFFLNSFGDGPANQYVFNNGFTNLVSLQMPPNTRTAVAFFQFGNLTVQVQDVPEPGSWSLVLLGLTSAIRPLRARPAREPKRS
jgi:hypothetical protein